MPNNIRYKVVLPLIGQYVQLILPRTRKPQVWNLIAFRISDTSEKNKIF